VNELSPERGALSGLLPLLDDIPAYRSLAQQLSSPSKPRPAGSQALSLDLLHSARAYLLAALQRDLPGGMLVIAAQPDRARQLAEQIRQYSLLPGAVHYFPAPDTLFYDKSAWALETAQRRVVVMAMLAQLDLLSDYEGASAAPSRPIVVTSLAALMPKTIPPMQLLQHLHELRVGRPLDLNALLAGLLQGGYQPTSVVEEPGFFSRRGGIIDVYSPAQPHPLRVELFGDEIESLRFFDSATQRSLGGVQQITLYPASEALPAYGAAAVRWIKEADLGGLQPLLRQRWQQDAESLEYGEMFRGIEFYLPFLYEQPASLLSYLVSSSLLVLDDEASLAGAAQAIAEQAEKTRAEMVEEGALPTSFPLPYFSWQQLSADLRARPAINLGFHDEDGAAKHPLDCFAAAENFGGQLTEMIEDCRVWQKQRRRVLILTSQVSRLKDLFQEEEIYPLLKDEIVELPPQGGLTMAQGNLPEGWAILADKPARRAMQRSALFTLLTDNEIFGWAKHRRHREVRRRSTSPEAFFSDYKEGDYVVHIEHGVALYRGLSRKTFDGVEREYLDLEYASGDRLFVPVNQADRVARYVGVGELSPVLQRLGTADWERVKEKAEKAVADIAEDLLKLYAAREIVPGHAFAADTVWQDEMEAAFPYEETEDQLRTISEVKADMEKPRPMDRLICGDVGYGKTEVALRAAFKAVMDSRQVAILVPTTVLAQQHYLTFRDRLEAFPIKVEMLSRFRSRQEQHEIIKRLGEGQVDIVVGTHRLLQRDVAFKDLGLLIIDEEQRFGVAHKERLKQLRGQVDVLTLTATPIPRTLHMALTGARDMSTIDTPPEERLPVRSQVAESSDSLIRKAILREKSRGGQVYFVHNRVQGIRQVAQHLHQIAPEVSLVVGHGQMDEDELSRVMLDFMDGKYDVLICTTIIESGLDIPNVNTIIINHADKFGLAQLYQLRGRVGRSASQAYAYFLYSKGQSLSEIGRKRLEAIMEASELGAGFRLAMRDMEMRGAGEILGARQHGHIAAVGFDLYTRLLAQAVRELQDKRGAAPGAALEIEAGLPFTALSPFPTSKVDLPLTAHLPEEYVPDVALRLRLYQRMANLRTLDEIGKVAQELGDRFGPLPEPVENLLYLLRIKVLADQIGATSVAAEGPRVFVRFPSPEALMPLKPTVLTRFGQIAKIAPAFISIPWGRGGSLSQQTLLQLSEALAEAAR
jgi:transcription-repair coupling factor (superfamily II helicase)